MGFAKFSSLGGALEAELKAIHLGLEIITGLPQISNTVIESDSSEAVKLLLHDFPNCHPYAIVIENCKCLLSKLRNYQILKVSRQQNACADILAKEGRKRKLPLTVYHEVPQMVVRQYQNDRRFSSPA